MLISTQWIRDFVEVPKESPEQIAEKVTLATAEVEEAHRVNTYLKAIKIAQIKGIRKHPQADRLKLVRFDDGQEREVVCGAPNVQEGLKIPYAPVGVTLPTGLTIEPKKIRGYLSEGMLCSELELGLGESSQGLMELPADAPVGLDLLSFLQKSEDILLDVDNKSLTHRPDLWGHYGMAREFATIWKCKLANPFDQKWHQLLEQNFTDDPSPLRPVVDEQSAGLSYWALSVNGIEVTSSPQWMQERLKVCGMRPINSIVDISNYVMLELGMPNHIFDRQMITGDTLQIRPVGKAEKFTTLDGERRGLLETDTVISDGQKPLVIGGIMGGLQSGVTEKTQNILIEVANWKSVAIRRTCNRLGLRTESSQRYEKSLDGNLCYRTLLRILQLVLEFNPKASVVGRPEYDGVDLEQTPKVVIKTSAERISAQLGRQVSEEGIREILHSLDFAVTKGQGQLSVAVPSYRATKDIEVESDIVEEVGRIIGYGQIDPLPPMAPIERIRLSAAKLLHRKIQDYLVFRGRCLEVMTYPLVGESLLKKCHWSNFNEQLVLANSISLDHDRMRPSLLPSMLKAVALNQKHQHRFQFFELGRCYTPDRDEFAREHSQVAMAFFDRKNNRFQEIINELENLLRSLHVPANIVGQEDQKHPNPIVDKDWIGCHPQQYQNIRIMGKETGVAFSVHPLFLRKFKIKGMLSLAVIDITQIEQKEWPAQVNYKPLAKYPSSTFDCTVICGHHIPIADILNSFKKVKLAQLTQFKAVDIFIPKKGPKCVTIRATLFDPDGTLSGETVRNCELAIVAGLGKAGFPLKP